MSAPLSRSHGVLELDIAPSSVLEVSTGLVARKTFSESVTFQIVATSESGRRVLLYHDQERSPAGGADWVLHRIPLDDMDGRWSLEFSTASTSVGWDHQAGLQEAQVHFSAPVIVGDSPGNRPKNLILISIDTLRADRLGVYGYSRNTSSNLERWFAKQGVIVEQCLSSAPTTLSSHATMFSGVRPSVALVEDKNGFVFAPWLPTLADYLRAQGYRTAAFTENAYVGIDYGFDRGFEEYYENKASSSEELAVGFIEDIYTRGLEWVRRPREAPFFLFLHTYEVHHPYTSIPTDLAHLFPTPADATPERVESDRYDREIVSADRHTGRLLDELDRIGALENTLLVVTSDHGEEFGEHGRIYHGAGLYSESVRVPLLMRAPGLLPEGVRRRGPIGLVDLTPTLLDFLGLAIPQHFEGLSYADYLIGGGASEPAPIYAEARGRFAFGLSGVDKEWISPTLSVTDWPHRLLRIRTPHGARHELYDLEADPLERRNIFDSEGHAFAKLVRDLEGYEDEVSAVQSKMFATLGGGNTAIAPSGPLDPERLRKLEALGYLSAPD